MEHACSDGACLSDKVAVQRYVSSRVYQNHCVCVRVCVCVWVCRWCARPLPLGPIANYTKPQVTLYHTHTTHHTHHTTLTTPQTAADLMLVMDGHRLSQTISK